MILQAIFFLQRSTSSHAGFTAHISFIRAYFSSSSILLWLLTKENTEVILLSLSPKNKNQLYELTNICVPNEENEANYLNLGRSR